MAKGGLQSAVMYVVCHMGLIFFLYPSRFFSAMQTGHWIGIVFSYAVQMTVVFLYIMGLRFAKNQTVIDIFRSAGRVVPWIVLLPAFLYLVVAFIVTIRAYSEMLTLIFLSNTPLWAILLLLFLVAFVMAWQGIGSMARTALLLAILFSGPLLFVLYLSFQNVDWYYALPFVGHKQTFTFITDVEFQVSLFVYAGGFFFLGLLPVSIPINMKKMAIGGLLLLPMYLLSVYLPLLTFGQSTAELYEFPMLMTIDTVNVTWLMFDRITIFFLLSLMAFALLYMAVTLWTLMTLTKKALPFIPDPYGLIGLTILLFVISLAIPDWDFLKQLQIGIIPLRLYIFIVIPVLTFIMGWRLKNKANRKAEVS
ncbi:spore gernimation protein [Paenibacillus glucanolyticus]|uniref:Spore gernimation protein n=2 Tax=Paenibacillus TaxID=44249 RepID=A0A163LTN4_9BACL|nr:MULTISPECIES: GerAB/ArcD/ProY family transporter [Paenibacillus]AWP28064.1 spore gernimation protein [Paenibacillus sp. Cedars]KZS48451.1 spore gernimation protein [Paenibacillus glucanolyticus]